MSKHNTASNDIEKPGFMLLKQGKTIAGTRYKRGADITIFENGKKKVLKNITKKSYVPNSEIKKMSIDLKHFESKVSETIPAIEK